jgi:hypothetical protein
MISGSGSVPGRSCSGNRRKMMTKAMETKFLFELFENVARQLLVILGDGVGIISNS